MKNDNIPLMDAAIARFIENYFDKVFVITINRAKERQENVKKQLSGLPFEFFYGTDKENLNLEQLIKEQVYDEVKTKKLDRFGKSMILGEIACALSHRKLYEHILAKEYQRVLIFEDDVVSITENFHLILETLTELPPEWELVYLGYSKNEEVTARLKRQQYLYKLLSRLRFMKWNRTMVNNYLPARFSEHLSIAGFHDCTHAYAVTLSALKKFVSYQTPIVFSADNLLSYCIMNGHIKAFKTEPKFFGQLQFANPSELSLIHQ